MKVKTFIVGCLIGMFVALLIYTPISQTQTERQYDPWADINDDRIIDMKDIGYLCKLYTTAGDPTKPIEIVGYKHAEGSYDFSLLPNEDINWTIPTAGFKTLAIRVQAYSIDCHDFQIYVAFKIKGEIVDDAVYTVHSETPFGILIVPPEPWGWTHPAEFEKILLISFTEITIWIWNNSTSYDLWGSIYYYLTA